MEKRCFGCMGVKGEELCCPSCGWRETDQNKLHQLPTGTVLHGQYLMGRVLGQGGFGITYLGWDLGLEAPVAIKEYFPISQVNRTQNTAILATDDDAFRNGRERFLREAQALAKLRHLGGIVQVYNVFPENGTAYIVMEYIEGTTLLAHMRKLGRPLTVEETFTILRPVMQVMAQVHDAGIVHRDISPDNIMLKADGSVKILDFGTARTVEDGQLTHSTQAVLKNGFAPMEQYSAGRSIDQRADEYALCATIYYCLTGKVPPSAFDLYMDKTDIPWNQVPGLTPRQTAALEKGAAMRAEDRFPSLRELEQELFAKDADIVPPVVPVPPAPKPQPEKKMGKAGAMIAAALAAVAVLAGGIWLGGRSSEAPATLAAETTETEVETTVVTAAVETTVSTFPVEPTEATVPAETEEPTEATEAPKDIFPLSIQEQTICGGLFHTVGLEIDGAVVAVGDNDYGQCEVSGWTDIVAVAAGDYHTVGLKTDGSVVAAGSNIYGQCDVSIWTDIVAVAACGNHTVGLKSDGSVVAAGSNIYGQCDVSIWTDIVAVATDYEHTVGLKADNSVVAVGYNYSGRCNVSGWTDIVAIAAGYDHTVGLKADGSVVAVGSNTYGRSEVFGWTDIVAITTGNGHTVGLKADGTVIAVGAYDSTGECEVSDWTQISVIAAGRSHTVGLKADGSVVAVGRHGEGQCDVSGWKLRVPGET